MPDHGDDDETPDLPPEIEQVLRGLTGGGELDPQLAQMMQGMGLDRVDPQMLQMVMGQVQAMFTGPASDTAVDATMATDIARKTVSASGDALATDADGRAAAEAVHVAGLWLDSATDLTGAALRGLAWSRAEWVEATMPVWADLVEPVAEGVTEAVGSIMQGQLEDLPEDALPAGMAGMLDQAGPMLRRIHGSMFSLQLGQGVGTLAGEVLTGCEVSLPLVAAPDVVLMPAAVRALAEGLEVDEAQTRLYLAVREVARVRLFAAVPWLAPGLLAAVRDYASDITIDTDAIEEAVRTIDPSDPQAVQEAVQGRMFAPQHSPAQQAALARLETLLALVEGWVDVVTERATAGHLPSADALGEAVRRRRASGGPAEKAFGALVGLELRPRRLRDAANLFRALEDSGGADARDAAWRHPDLAPSTADLDDPLGYVERSGSAGTDDLDAELDALLRGEGER
ncbi:zinc-dependent metalloprotease [Phycicoccus flavus]|uniref:Zinc-dependent metalloprotease n=1 Tax=Phycicoccus flavus TaxID=2502783 RepID=A0A8T6R259_9MICO|nr:zinc-dependent metalloprotease [Phycicoccus flavus]NHA66905.1 zinc-dependent metalloprotease [Phycicoccus flavus]